MSGKKNSIEGLSYHLDSQFQVQTLVDDSSQSSSKKDHDNQEKHYEDVSDQQRQAKSIKSMDNIDQIQRKLQFQYIQDTEKQPSQQTKNNDTFTFSPPQQNHTPEKKVKNIQNNLTFSPTDLQQQKYEKTLQKKKKKRRLIFDSIKLGSNEKSKIGSGSKNTQKQDLQAIQISKQHTTFSRASFEKKRQNHVLLKAWNYRRLKLIELHQKISQSMTKTIDRISKNSLQNFQTFRTFLNQKCRQQQLRISLKLPIKEQIQNNSHATDIYIACSSVFSSMIKRQKQQKEIIINFINYVQSKIIKEIIDDYLNNTFKKMIILRSKIALMKQTLDKLDQSSCKKLIQLQTNFTKCCENVLQDQPNDFYQTQISFLIKCQSQISLHNKYGQMIIQFYKQAVEEQYKRKQCIQKSLKLFLAQNRKYQQRLAFSKHKSLSHFNQLELQNKNNTENQQIKDDSNAIEQMYKIQKIIQQQTIKQIIVQSSKQNGSSENNNQQNQQIGEEQIQYCLTKLEIQQFDCHHLIIKKFKIEILKQGKWIPGQIVITVDKFVHIFVYAIRNTGVLIFGSQNFYDPEFTMKAYLIKLSLPTAQNNQQQIGSEDELEVVLSTNKQQSGLEKFAAFLKSSKKMEQTIRFGNENSLLQFQDYLIQLST